MRVFLGTPCGVQSVYSQLGYCKEEKSVGWLFLDWQILGCFRGGDPKGLAESQNFLISTEDDVCQNALRKPLNKEDKKPRTNVPKTRCLVTLHVLTSCSEDTTH